MPDSNIKKLIEKTYLKVIENSIGSKMFRNLYVVFKDSKKTKDVLENGNKSCAFYVSSVLSLFEMVKKTHATVKSTFDDMIESGWKKTKKPQKGDVIIWEEKKGYTHIGFLWNKKEAISNSSEKKLPIKHSIDFKGKRKIIDILHFNFKLLEKNDKN